MEKMYTLNDVSLMTGFTTRTLRNYLTMGILKGSKENGVWQFSLEELDAFFANPYVKEGLRIKHSGIVFDFLADHPKKEERTCVVLDVPGTAAEANALSAFFCECMNHAEDTVFTFDYDHGSARIILSGRGDQIGVILSSYYARNI